VPWLLFTARQNIAYLFGTTASTQNWLTQPSTKPAKL